MAFAPDAPPGTERRKVVITDNGGGSITVAATRTFLEAGLVKYKLDLTGQSGDLDSALQAAQNFMRSGVF